MLAPMSAPRDITRGSTQQHREARPQLGSPCYPQIHRGGYATTWAEHEKRWVAWSCYPICPVISCMRWFVKLYSVTVCFDLPFYDETEWQTSGAEKTGSVTPLRSSHAFVHLWCRPQCCWVLAVPEVIEMGTWHHGLSKEANRRK